LLREAWKQFPDMRLGQLICAAVRHSEMSENIYSVEDDEVSQGLERLLSLKNDASD
jgi:hypothetical protein